MDRHLVDTFENLLAEPGEIGRQIHRDWTAAEKIADNLQFYTVPAVQKCTTMFLDKWVYSSERDDPPTIIDGRMVVHYKRHIDWFLEHRSQRAGDVIMDLVKKYKANSESLKELPADSLEHDAAVQTIHKILVLVGTLAFNELNQILLQKFPGVLLKSHSQLPHAIQQKLRKPFL